MAEARPPLLSFRFAISAPAVQAVNPITHPGSPLKTTLVVRKNCVGRKFAASTFE
jgi:hypothetical protein